MHVILWTSRRVMIHYLMKVTGNQVNGGGTEITYSTSPQNTGTITIGTTRDTGHGHTIEWMRSTATAAIVHFFAGSKGFGIAIELVAHSSIR